VPRVALKAALLQAVGPAPLHFGRHCTGYRQGDEDIEAHFADGTSAQAAYLIACDGVSSALRKPLSGDEKRYLGLTSIVCVAPLLIQHPLVQGGYFMTLGDDGSSAFCYRQSDSVALSYTVHAPSEDDLNAQTPAELVRRIQQATSTWHPPIPHLVTTIDEASVVVRGYYDREPLTRVREGRLWLIGDAAHPMAPSQGLGANLGMVDGLQMAQYFAGLVSNPNQAEEQAQALEAEIITRGRKAVLASRAAASRLHLTNRMQRRWCNVGFRIGNLFIQQFSREASQSK